MHPPIGGCPPWEYERHPDAHTLRARCEREITSLLAGEMDTLACAVDTRPVHGRLFQGLTPPGFGYYAGNYRGSDYPCLIHHDVGVASDPLVGFPAQLVRDGMSAIRNSVHVAVSSLDGQMFDNDVERLLHAVRLAALAFHKFLTVHPYVNGNGHAARFIVWAILRRYGFTPTSWTIDPRPAIVDYGPSIAAARRGAPQELERLILESLAP